MTNITDLELKLIKSFDNGSMANDAEEMEDDNMTWTEMSDFKAAMPKMSEQQIGGILTGLNQKGLIGWDWSVDMIGRETKRKQFFLNGMEAYNAYFS